MADLLTNAFQIAKVMYDHRFFGSNTITVAELRNRIDMAREDFDEADIYLLEARYCDGTMGGDLGQRRLTTSGIDFVNNQSRMSVGMEDRAVTPVSILREEPEPGHVLYMDIVGFSKLRLSDQQQMHEKLTGLVQALSSLQRDKAKNELLILPTGDGMALIFFKGLKRHVDAAIEISKILAERSEIALRIGIHSGPVQKVLDVNGQLNVVGPGINTAQRVMDCGDAGHILLSKELADVLKELGGWDDALEDLGTTKVKHDKEVYLFNLRGDGFGNSDKPSKLSAHVEVNSPKAEGSLSATTIAPNNCLRVLITTSDGKAVITNAERVESGENLKLTLIPSEASEIAFLSDLKRKPRELIGIAYLDRGLHAHVASISSSLEQLREVWSLEVKPFQGDYRGGGLGEMSCGTFSADDIAEMRARRILLNEHPPDYITTEDQTTRQINNAMLEAFVQGITTQVKVKGSMIPLLFEAADGDIPGFLEAARLFSVLWLHVSGVIEHIFKLDMQMRDESELDVKFEGRRPRTFVNVEPTVIKFEGICKLTDRQSES